MPVGDRFFRVLVELPVPALASTSTQLAFDPSMMCVCSGGTGSAVSIADACGCTRSGQFGSHSQSGLPQRLQKCRRAELRVRLPVSSSRMRAR